MLNKKLREPSMREEPHWRKPRKMLSSPSISRKLRLEDSREKPRSPNTKLIKRPDTLPPSSNPRRELPP